MTVADEQIEVIVAAPAMGGTVNFTFDYQGGDQLDVRLLRAGRAEELALAHGADWTSTPAQRATGGTLTLLADPTGWDELLIRRATDIEQPFDAPPSAAGFEAALDRTAMVQQELQHSLDGRLSLPVGLSGLRLPPPAAGKLLGWSAAGNAIENRDGADLSSTEVTPTGGAQANLADLLGGAAPLPRLEVESDGSFVVDLAGLGAGTDAGRWRLRNQGDGKLLLQRLSDDKTAGQTAVVIDTRTDFTIGDETDPDHPDDAARYRSTGPDGSTSAAEVVKTIAFIADRTLVCAEKQGTSTGLTTLRGVVAANFIEPPWTWETAGLFRSLQDGSLTIFSRLNSPVPLWCSLAFGLHDGVFGMDRGGRFAVGTRTPRRKLHVVERLDATAARFSAPADGTCEIELEDSGTVTPPSIGSDGDDVIVRIDSTIASRFNADGLRLNGLGTLAGAIDIDGTTDIPEIAAGAAGTSTITVTGATEAFRACITDADSGASALLLRRAVVTANTVTLHWFNAGSGTFSAASGRAVKGYAVRIA